VYRTGTGVSYRYWCIVQVLVYRTVIGVSYSYWCIVQLLVYRTGTGVSYRYWCIVQIPQYLCIVQGAKLITAILFPLLVYSANIRTCDKFWFDECKTTLVSLTYVTLTGGR
jgi:hypothetical protein